MATLSRRTRDKKTVPEPPVILVDINDDGEDDFKPKKVRSKCKPLQSTSVESPNVNLQKKRINDKSKSVGDKHEEKVSSKTKNCMSDAGGNIKNGKEKGVGSGVDLTLDLENVGEVEVLFSKESTSPQASKSITASNDGKTAWKSLMEQMQINQKKGTGNGKTLTSKAKSNFKRGLTQSPKQKKGASMGVQSPLKKVPRLLLQKLDHKSSSIPQPKDEDLIEEIDLSDNEAPNEKPTFTSSSSSSSPPKNTNNTDETKVALAPIFLPPSERKQTLQHQGQSSSTSSLLDSIIASSQFDADFNEEEPGTDDPKLIHGNTVLLNLDQPDGDPYEGNKTKTCPFYKKLPGVPFCVDAFNYGLVPGMEVYFLSHFHSDHYIGLTKKFCKTLICSRLTGNLVRMKLYVQEKCIRKLRLNKPYIICGSEVTLINANHCPGSVMFLFRLTTGQTILHTGDFRYSPEMLKHPSLLGPRTDVLYLDTTYCSPRYDFPTQMKSVSTAVAHVKKHLNFRPKTLILCGSYLIGKERVYMTLAEAIGSKVFVLNDKRKIINALENKTFNSLITTDENAACIHVLNMFSISAKSLGEYLEKRPQYTNIIGIKPSGWQFSSSGAGCNVTTNRNDTVTILGIPYSEHSSFSELKEFVTSLRPRRVQPTVNVGNAKKRGEMMQHIENWLST